MTNGIKGLDQWLTTPPEDPDWVEEGEKFLKKYGFGDDELVIDACQIIEGLLSYVEEQ